MKSIEVLTGMAEAEGFSPGTVSFERRIRQLKVIQCREYRNVPTCLTCELYLTCDLIEAVKRDKLDAAREKAEDKKSDNE